MGKLEGFAAFTHADFHSSHMAEMHGGLESALFLRGKGEVCYTTGR